ncbi:MAG TPA: translocation/assembly module TamB domain-containing protein, partial [Terriglobales bacterium]|nr:translocation/assembly module TamB domain-containing protein [Terriglobales bacterium]
RSGIAQINGNLTYYAGQYRAAGTTEVQGAGYRAGSANVAGVNARADFVGDNNGLQLNDIRGTALGGTFEGSAAVQAALTQRGHLHEHGTEEQGTAQLRFRGFDVQKLESAMPRQERELHIPIRGSLSGTVAARWTGTPDKAVAQINANVAPPATTSPGEVPVTAAVQATYDGVSGKLNVQQLRLSTPGSKIEATGALGTNGAAMHLSLATSNFAELHSALAYLGVDFTVPAEVRGPLSFTGSVSGTRADPQVNGHIVANDVDYLAEFTAEALVTTPHPPPATQPLRIHWDRVTADLQYSSHAVSLRNATLQAGAARDVVSGSATLADGHIVPTSRIDLQANVENEDLTRLAALAGTRSPVQGLVSGSVRLSGTASNPTGGGAVRITNVPLGAGQATIASAFTLRDHQATFTNLDIARGPDRLGGTATLNVVTNAFSFNIHGGPIELASLPEVQSARISLTGKLTFTLEGSGTTTAPEINGTAHVANLAVNGESLGDLNSQATTRAGVMQVSAATTGQTAQLAIDGTVRLQGDYPANLTVKFPHLDFDPLLHAYLKGRVTGHSLAVGAATINGPLKNPSLLTVDAKVEQFLVAIEGFELKNIAPVHLRVANTVLTLDQFHIAGTNTDLTATGAIPLTGARNMSLTANGTIDLALIQTLNHNFTSAGKVMLNARAEGTPAHPVFTGRVDVQNASIAYVDLPNGLSEVNGTLMFDQNRLVVQKLTGQSGGGALTFGGYLAYSNGLSFALTSHVQDMRMRYPPGVSTIANADLRWTGSPTASTVAGDLMLTRFNISPQFDFASYVTRAGQPLPTVEAVNSPLNNIRLDVHVVSAPALQVSTSLAKVSGDIDLRIRGTLADPSILGRINIVRGTVYFNGTNYQVQRGDITFLNPTTIEPILNLAFTTRIAGYDINLSLDGPVDRLHTSYRSDPPLPSTDIISLLAFRQCPTSATYTCSPSAVEQAENYNASVNPSFTETASNQILGEALNATLSNRVQHLFGISRVKISPEVANTIGNPSARITVEQRVSNNVTVTYVTDVSQAQQQVIQVEYNINRNLSIVAVRDQFGVASFDVRIRQRKR